MSVKVLCDYDELKAIADIVRSKNNTTDTMSLTEMTVGINDIGGTKLPELTNEGETSDLLSDKQLIDSDGNVLTGTMKNNGAINATFDGINTTTYTVPAGYTSGGSVSLDNTINNEINEQADLIAEIKYAIDNLPEQGSGNVSTNAGEWIEVASLPQTYLADPFAKTYYLEIPLNTVAIVVRTLSSYQLYYRTDINSYTLSYTSKIFNSCTLLTDEGSLYLEMVVGADTYTGSIYVLPIYAME